MNQLVDLSQSRGTIAFKFIGLARQRQASLVAQALEDGNRALVHLVGVELDIASQAGHQVLCWTRPTLKLCCQRDELYKTGTD